MKAVSQNIEFLFVSFKYPIFVCNKDTKENFYFISEENSAAEATFVQPKFIPTGPIKNPVTRGKPQL